jgi:hypothetical protein
MEMNFKIIEIISHSWEIKESRESALKSIIFNKLIIVLTASILKILLLNRKIVQDLFILIMLQLDQFQNQSMDNFS